MKKILNYYELKAMYVEFQERITEAEGVEKIELEKTYEQWKKDNDICFYCKAWGCELYGICPVCDKKPCECEVVEPEEEEEK